MHGPQSSYSEVFLPNKVFTATAKSLGFQYLHVGTLMPLKLTEVAQHDGAEFRIFQMKPSFLSRLTGPRLISYLPYVWGVVLIFSNSLSLFHLPSMWL